jgi:hypothetical protein
MSSQLTLRSAHRSLARAHSSGDRACRLSTKTRRRVVVRQCLAIEASHGQKITTLYSACDSDTATTWKKQHDEPIITNHNDYNTNLVKHFLPAQFPHSVAPGYAWFVTCGFGASIAGSASMVLSTQTLLLAVGVVGHNAAQAGIMAGALNWVLKDGT